MFGSSRSVTAGAVALFDYIQSQDAASFSLRDCVQGGRSVLSLPYQAGQIVILGSLLST